MDLADHLRGGFFPAVPVPFDQRGRFARGAQERYVRYLSEQPVTGAAVWAHTGRGLHLDADLADEVLASWRSALRGRILIAGAGGRVDPAIDDASYIESAGAMARRAASGGADALLAYAPARFRGHPRRSEMLLRYHDALAGAGLPVIAFYLYEAAGGIQYTAEELRAILSRDEVVGIKMATLDSVCTYQDVAVLLRRELPRTVLITGEDRFLGYSIQCGAESALVGMGAACPAFQKELLDAWRAGSARRFLELTALADRFAQSTFTAPMEGYIQRMLHALAVLGVIPEEATHDPWCAAISRAERDRVARAIEELREAGAA